MEKQEMTVPLEVMQHLQLSFETLTAKVAVLEVAMQEALRLLEPRQRRRFAEEFRASANDLLGTTDDHPGGQRIVRQMTNAVNAYLEAAGQPPRRPEGE